MSLNLWLTESVTGHGYAWWMEQVPTLRPPVLHTGALPTELPIRCSAECLQGWPAGYDPASRGPQPRVLPLNYGHTCRHSSGMPGCCGRSGRPRSGIGQLKRLVFCPLELRTCHWWRAGRIERLARREPGYSRPWGPPQLIDALRRIWLARSDSNRHTAH